MKEPNMKSTTIPHQVIILKNNAENVPLLRIMALL
jgi:hypothetical protein